jgi:cobalamin synthase
MTRIPLPPKGCYPSCNKDKEIAERLGQYMIRAAIVFGLIVGLLCFTATLWAIRDLAAAL